MQREEVCLLLGNLGTDVLDGETRWQALPQLFSLFTILEDQSVQVPGTPDLELGDDLALSGGGLGLFGEDGVGGGRGGVESGLLDLGGLGVLSPGDLQELLDVGNLLGHG